MGFNQCWKVVLPNSQTTDGEQKITPYFKVLSAEGSEGGGEGEGGAAPPPPPLSSPPGRSQTLPHLDTVSPAHRGFLLRPPTSLRANSSNPSPEWPRWKEQRGCLHQKQQIYNVTTWKGRFFVSWAAEAALSRSDQCVASFFCAAVSLYQLEVLTCVPASWWSVQLLLLHQTVWCTSRLLISDSMYSS